MSEVSIEAVGAATAVVLATAYVFLRKRLDSDALKGVGKPRKVHTLPSTLPVLGNLLDMTRHAHDRHDWLVEVSQSLDGEPFWIKVPGMPDLMVLSQPELYEQVLNTQFDNFEKGEFQRQMFEDLLGKGLISSDGERWYHQRKAAVKFFTARSLRTYTTVALKNSMTQLYSVLDASVGKHQVDLGKLFMDLTLQTFVQVGLGVDIQCIGSATPHPFGHAADIAPPIVTRRTRLPPFVWKMERLLKIGQEGELLKAMDVVYSWVRELVQEGLANLSKKNTQDGGDDDIKSVVELFAEHSHEDLEGLRTEDLVDFLLTFVLAARDTTGLSLTWLFYALSKYPEVQQKIREEMARELGGLVSDKDVYLTVDHIRGLRYLEATIKEALRYFPVIPFIRRTATVDTVLEGDLVVRKGQFVGMSAYLMGRNPKVWGPDAAEFKPERWIDTTTGEVKNVASTKFFGFGTGPRTCIGMNLAMMQLRVVSANLLKRYKLHVDLANNDGSYVMSPGLAMKHPLMVRVERTDIGAHAG